LKIGIF